MYKDIEKKRENERRFHRNHPGSYKERKDRWRKNNLEISRAYTRKNAIKNRNLWLTLIIKPRGWDKCSKCGYNKCFAAIEFHHEDPTKKKFKIGNMLTRPITPERIEELNKTKPLCANCHREKEAGLW